MTRQPSVWCSKYYFFFIISCKILCKNCFNLFSYNFTKIKIKSFEGPKSIRNYKKNNAWNIRRLVDSSFVQVNQQTRVLYCRLSDLFSVHCVRLWTCSPFFWVPMFWLYWTSALSKRKMSNLFFCIEGLFHFFQIPFKASSERKQQVASKNRPILYYLDLINYSLYKKLRNNEKKKQVDLYCRWAK